MKTPIDNTFEGFKVALKNSPDLQKEFQEDPVKAAETIVTKNPIETDSWIYRIIVISLGLAILTIVVTLTIMSMKDGNQINAQVITIFTAISSGAIGALAGLLAPSPGKN